MILPKALEAEFWQEFKEFEQERTMTYITTGERIGYERGKQAIILRQLQRRVGLLPQEIQTSIENLSENQLENLGDALLDFTGSEDLHNWLENNQ
jgi:predicted transposase YdaD